MFEIDFDDYSNYFDSEFIEDDEIINGFKSLIHKKIVTKTNIIYNEIESQTLKMYFYFLEKTDNFIKIFEQNFSSLEETYKYLESISIPNKCECAGIIDTIPGWRCADCSQSENVIYCSNCYIKSKHLHKGHKVYYLRSSGGMCDCGDPDSLYTFCQEHCGPYTEQKQIDELIEKSFSKNVLNNLKIFFDDFFLEFSKYLILTEKCEYFYNEVLEEDEKTGKEKSDILLLKKNFVIIFQNFLNFIYKITKTNLGMFHLVSIYLLKNHFKNEVIDENFKTSHSCILIEDNDIKILYKDKIENEDILSYFSINRINKHKCECPFIRLLFSNWRDIVKPYEIENQNVELLLSFSHNFFLRRTLSILLLFILKELLINNNKDILYIRSQYALNEAIGLLVNKTDIIEDNYDFLYNYIKKHMNLAKYKNIYGAIKNNIIKDRLLKIGNFDYDDKIFSKPNIRLIMNSKKCLFQRLIDIACLIHNQMEFESIFPHPVFQEKKCLIKLIDVEEYFLSLVNSIFLCIQWENIDSVKIIFDYFIEKIIYKKELKILKINEFSYHLTLYRTFGIFLNIFCFNYALINKINIIDSIDIIKNKLFGSKDKMQKVIKIILYDYYKMFGFLIGIRNEYFNYYDIMNYNYIYFSDSKELKYDFTLLKYLLAMSEEVINIEDILKISNLENVYSFFKNIFNSENKNNKKENVRDEDGDKHVMQWRLIFEIIISIIKNDTTPIWGLISFYSEVYSSKYKKYLFDLIRKNKNMMKDCKNMLKEEIVQNIIFHGNIIDLEGIKKSLDDFFFILFEEKELNYILEELTVSKINGEKKEFYLKDSSLNYLDMNYYYSPMIKSKAELYISEFKKDVFKIYNSYYYKPSKFTFDFHHKVYKNILLNVENINFFIKIIKVLLNQNNNEDKESYDLNSIRKVLLPVVLNFLSIFGCINSKSFIQFKKKNNKLINNIIELLNNAINNNKDNQLLDKELTENIFYVIKQLNKYKIINDYYNNNLNKLNDNDYNTYIYFKEQNNKKENILKSLNIMDTVDTEEEKKKNKIKDMKAFLKNRMKKNNDKFIKEAKKNIEVKKIIENKEIEHKNEVEDEIMCFVCRNKINLKEFDKPYCKLGFVFKDYFYTNSYISSIKSEINNILGNNDQKKEELYKELIIPIIKKKMKRITSCGHYLHQECFDKNYNGQNFFKCPLCEKLQNTLIPPLTNFYGKNKNLKPIKLTSVFNRKDAIKQNNKKNDNFKNVIIKYLGIISKNVVNLDSKSLKVKDLIQKLFEKYESFINFLNNLYFSDGTTFHKHQQIDNIQIFFLSIRYLINNNYIDINKIIKHIHKIIDNLIKESNIKDNIIESYINLEYNNYIEKLLFLFLILLDYDQLIKVFKYIVNWSLPYFIFWIYIKHLITFNNLYYLYDDNSKKRININEFKKFLKDNNKQMNNYLFLYLQKLYIISLLSKYDNKKDEINYNIKELSIQQLFSLLDMDTIYQSLSKTDHNEINFEDLLEKLPKIISEDKYSKNNIIHDYDKILNKMINNLKNQKQEKNRISYRLLVQFIPYKFKFILLDNNIFDWIENNLFKKCCFCGNTAKYFYICLICGKKICKTKKCNYAETHIEECTEGIGVLINIYNMKLTIKKNDNDDDDDDEDNDTKELYPLYVDESGVGPTSYEIGNEYNLSKEKIKLALRDYISNDIH